MKPPLQEMYVKFIANDKQFGQLPNQYAKVIGIVKTNSGTRIRIQFDKPLTGMSIDEKQITSDVWAVSIDQIEFVPMHKITEFTKQCQDWMLSAKQEIDKDTRERFAKDLL